MQPILGPLHEESYVHVHDVHAYAYGLGDITQEQRQLEREQAMSDKVARRA